MTLHRHPRLPADDPDAAAVPRAAPGRPGPGRETDPSALTTAVVQWYLEFRAGRRCVEQARELLSDPLRRRLASRARERRPAPAQRPVVRTLVQRRDRRTLSAVALVRHEDGDRVTALSLQFRHDGERWRLTELGAPEDRVPPEVRRPAPRGTS